MKKIYFSLILALFSIMGISQNDPDACNCCSAAQKQFDFWLGSWQVYDTTGNKVGENKILSLQNHCVLQENWTSPNSTGTSYNYYNAADQSWNQLWIDNRGNPLELKGSFEEGKMVMRDKLRTQKDGTKTYNQISWEAMADGSVVQTWEVMNQKGERINLLFKGIYRKE